MRLPPYKPHGKGYVANGVRYRTLAIRPTKGAAGMACTTSRRPPRLDMMESDDARSLSLRGTLDVLHGGSRRWMDAPSCPCCGAPGRGKLRLNEAGRARLRRLRRSHLLNPESAP